MEWNQSDVLALATEKCTTCEGYGMRPTRNGADRLQLRATQYLPGLSYRFKSCHV